MRHQVDITFVITAHLFKPIGKLLPFGEKLFEAAEATTHRVTPRINDFGIGQDKMDQADMPEIIGHLVDEIRCPRFAVDRRVADISFTEPRQFFV